MKNDLKYMCGDCGNRQNSMDRRCDACTSIAVVSIAVIENILAAQTPPLTIADVDWIVPQPAPKQMIEYISAGIGRQSTAVIIANVRRMIANPVRVAIFSDTGSEMPETYEYLETHLKPYCQREGVELITVRRADFHPTDKHESLEAFSLDRRTVPSTMLRWCTDKFKKYPQEHWLREHGYGPKDAKRQLGIATEEAHRMSDDPATRYPLIELGFSTDDCLALIKKAGLPIPVKSGCWFCPFQRPKQWQSLREIYPELAGRALAMEANAISNLPIPIEKQTAVEANRGGKKTRLPIFGRLDQFYFNLDNQPMFPGFDPAGNWTEEALTDHIEGEIKCPSYGTCFT